jgi:RNA polymerase sigma factor (sigma-70 family)
MLSGGRVGEDVKEPEELVAFCRREWPRLVGSLCLSTGDPDLAEELAQETLARACRDWRRVSRLDAPGAWAHRVALNLLRSHFRHRAVVRRHRDSIGADDHAPDADPTNAVTIRLALMQLPPRQRTALALRYFSDLSVRETAVAMRCPEGTVKTLTRQAIAGLRSMGLVTDEAAEEESMTDVQ